MTVSVRTAMLGRAVRTFPLGSVPRTPCPRAGAWGCCRTAGAPGSRSHTWCCRETRRSRGSSLHSWGEGGSNEVTESHWLKVHPPSAPTSPYRCFPTWTTDYGSEEKGNRGHGTEGTASWGSVTVRFFSLVSDVRVRVGNLRVTF